MTGVTASTGTAATSHIANGLRTEDGNAIDDLRLLDLKAAADQSISLRV